jgi:hypothetical protein
MNLAFPAVLGRNFGEPWAHFVHIPRFGTFPQPIGERAPIFFHSPDLTQDIISVMLPPTLDVRFCELIVVIEVTAALSALMTFEIVHVCP